MCEDEKIYDADELEGEKKFDQACLQRELERRKKIALSGIDMVTTEAGKSEFQDFFNEHNSSKEEMLKLIESINIQLSNGKHDLKLNTIGQDAQKDFDRLAGLSKE